MIEVFSERPDMLHHPGQYHPTPVIARVHNSITYFPEMPVARLQKERCNSLQRTLTGGPNTLVSASNGTIYPLCCPVLDNPLAL
jgi:hypothetical protein